MVTVQRKFKLKKQLQLQRTVFVEFLSKILQATKTMR